jgi:hypothetical protein
VNTSSTGEPTLQLPQPLARIVGDADLDPAKRARDHTQSFELRGRLS